jgi:hypothetical protein
MIRSKSSASKLAFLVGAMFAVPAMAQTTITQWSFENDPIALNNSPAPSMGSGTASAIGMTNSYNSTTSVNTDDVLQGVPGATGTKGTDTGTNGNQDGSQIWRVRGQTPGNGWSSQAPIGTQGGVFAASTAGYTNINVSFDWYATNQGEANLALEYTTNGTTWNDIAVTVPAADAPATAVTNASDPNAVIGSYVNGGTAGQNWFQNLTASIPNAGGDPNFAIEMVNATTGADNVAILSGTPLNNTSGNWRFDNVTISGTSVPEPTTLSLLAVSALGLLARRRRNA